MTSQSQPLLQRNQAVQKGQWLPLREVGRGDVWSGTIVYFVHDIIAVML